MSYRHKNRKEIKGAGIEIKMYTLRMETTTTPSNDFMPEEEWKVKSKDVSDDFFNKYRRKEIDGEKNSFGYYYYPHYYNEPLHVTEDFLFFFSFNKYYCLKSSLIKLPLLLDATGYVNSIQQMKAATEIRVAINFFEGHELIYFRER